MFISRKLKNWLIEADEKQCLLNTTLNSEIINLRKRVYTLEEKNKKMEMGMKALLKFLKVEFKSRMIEDPNYKADDVPLITILEAVKCKKNKK